MITREQIIAQARKYINVRWVHQGRSRELGLDCVGLLVVTAHDLGLSTYDFREYQPHPVGGDFLSHFEMNLVRIRPADELAGDILIFKQHESMYPFHCAFLTGDATIVHSSLKRRKAVEDIYEGHWKSSRIMTFRFPHLVTNER